LLDLKPTYVEGQPPRATIAMTDKLLVFLTRPA
jgi:hypothetical protein